MATQAPVQRRAAAKPGAQTHTDAGRLSRPLDRFERRGMRFLDQGRRQVRRRTR